MKKIVMVLMMVFGLSVVFADSYVAFTSEGAAALYESDEAERAVFDAVVKEEFEYFASRDKYSKQELKGFSHIIVVNETDILYRVWVYSDDSKVFGIAMVDDDGNPIGDYHYEASSKTDPVLVGLNFIKEIVFQVNNIDKNKVVYSSYAVEPVIE